MEKFKIIFDDYLNTVFPLEVDIRFWKYFINASIGKFQKENPVNRWISESGFSIYNIPLGAGAWLHVSKNIRTIEIEDLQKNHKEFFIWIMNLSLVRFYNSVELLLLRAIQHQYFPSLNDPALSRRDANKINEAIRVELKGNNKVVDTKNDRHLVEFLSFKSHDFYSFIQLSVNPINWKTSWKNFFEFISILRNIIAHQEMLVTPNVRNELKSIAGDMLLHYFEPPANNSIAEMLQTKSEDGFLNFVSHINDFAGNTLKFIAGEPSLRFIGLDPA